METKQVIIIRSDLKNKDGHKIRTGKLIAQACHASMKVILDMMNRSSSIDGSVFSLTLPKSSPVENWINGIFTKICLSVDSEEELVGLYETAKAMGIPCSLITDIGLTEFNGIPTKTAAAIGPYYSEQIDKITGGLKLL